MSFFRFTTLIFLFSFFTNISLSQEPARCGTDEIHEFNMQNDDEYKRSYFELQKKFGLSQNIEPTPRSFSNEVYTIPIVVHVFHDGDPVGEGSNVSDEVIYDAIAALNADFMGESFFPADNIGAPFFNAPVDVDIEFCLATVDPDGNPTNGITRQNPDSIAGYTQSGMVTTSILAENSELALKSLCSWPIAEYCNIYVVHKLNGGASPLGFAYLPPTNNPRDGIVVFRGVFGFNNNGNQDGQLYNNFDQSKTLTHEMGHYLGLYHTFHFTSGCGPETNCAGQGDALCDTPPTTGSVGCGPLTCYETMTENFMDYSNDDCMDRFSPDGRTRMRSRLLQHRSGLLDNGNCTPLDGVSVGTSSITIPSEGECTESFDNVSFTLTSNTLDTINYVTVNYQLDNEPSNSFIWNGLLTTGNYETVGLPTIGIPFGDHTLSIWTELPNGIEDSYTVNDTTILNFTNEPGTTVDINIYFDALPYGFSWMLVNLDTGELIDGGGGYANADYSCESITNSYCLPEGNYEVVLEDIFGNGMHYWCQVYEGPGSVTVTSGSDTLTYVTGNWGDEEILPFYVGPPNCVPTTCYGDADGNGFIWASDILIMLQYFGLEVEPCNPIDTDQDGIVGINDILDVIANFDSSCDGQLMPEGEFQLFLKKEKDGELLRTTLYNVMGQEIQDFDYIDTGMYIIVQEWMVPNVGVFKTNTKIFKE